MSKNLFLKPFPPLVIVISYNDPKIYNYSKVNKTCFTNNNVAYLIEILVIYITYHPEIITLELTIARKFDLEINIVGVKGLRFLNGGGQSRSC